MIGRGGKRGKNRTSMFDSSIELEAELYENDDDGPGGGDAQTTTFVSLRGPTEGPTPAGSMSSGVDIVEERLSTDQSEAILGNP